MSLFFGAVGREKTPVNIQRECYAMASKDGKSAEITMYGQIVERRPVDLWTGKPIEGNFIIKSEFLEDLKAVEGVKNLTIRLDSLGGDAYASLLIHNRLRELKGKKTVQVDGVAMSGGSIIMCAGDTVKVNPGSLIMIHKCLALMIGWYNEDDLDKVGDSNRAVDKALAAIYTRKSGMTEKEVLDMMGQETYMTGEEAVGMGFADELLEDEDAPQIAASADYRTLFVNGRTLYTMGYPLPEGIPVAPAAKAAPQVTDKPQSGEGGNEIMAKNLEELRTENPELAESIMAEARAEVAANANADIEAAVKAERDRLREIDSIASIYDDEMVNAAKYGEKTCSAQELAFRAAQQAAQKGKEFLDDMREDGINSNADKVPAAAVETNPVSNKDDRELSQDKRIAQGREAAKAINKK